MNYLINNHIIYDSQQGLLYDNIHNGGEEIKLTITLNRLLLVLVQNNNEVLDRETLLHRVWKDNNQVVSDNNLNSSISVLRRHLSSFSEDEFITTLPKVGIKFSAIIGSENKYVQSEYNSENEKFNEEIQNQPDLASEDLKNELANKLSRLAEKPSNVELDTKLEDLDEEKIPAKKTHVLNNRYVEIVLIFISLFCLIYLFKSYFFENKIEYPVVGQIDQCTIRYINSYHKPDIRSINISLLKERLTNLDINCKKSSTIFYYNVGIVTGEKNTSNDYFYISYCPNSLKDNTTVSCENFYVK